MPRFVTCGPNEAIIVSGCCHSTPTIRAGGRVFVWPMFHQIQRISLNTMTLSVESPDVHSEGGVPMTVKGVAQVKIQGKDLASLRAASEMFLGKAEQEIMDIAKATLDGHQRSMIASMRIEDIYKGRHEFSKNVQQSAQTDLIDMGLTLVSYTVQDISDKEGYLDALGKEKTIAVCTEAEQEVAKSETFAKIRDLESEFKQKQEKLQHEHSVALKRLEFDISKARYLKEHNENCAKSEKAGLLHEAEINKLLAKEKLDVILLEKECEADLIMKQKELRELELQNAVERKADYECQKEIEWAEALERQAKVEADLESEKIRRIAKAKAEAIKLEKEAEAEVLAQRAQAFLQFGNAAKLQMVLEQMPRLAAEVAGPISECKKITSVSQDGSVGFSRITNEIMEVVEQICESIGGLSAVSGTSRNDDDAPGPSNRKSSTESTTTTLAGSGRTTSSFGTRFGRNI